MDSDKKTTSSPSLAEAKAYTAHKFSDKSGAASLNESINQKFLQKPRLPRHMKSFADIITNRFIVDRSQDSNERYHVRSNFENRMPLQTSNTWTSSSGEPTSEDEIDDRASFIEEYNKIARKVCF